MYTVSSCSAQLVPLVIIDVKIELHVKHSMGNFLNRNLRKIAILSYRVKDTGKDCLAKSRNPIL